MKDTVLKYFPDLDAARTERFAALMDLYTEWNARINVISRKDMDCFYLHHVLHSLAIAKHTVFEPGSSVLDVGTGGGFPGIPLAIMYPDCRFTLCDSIGKKIKVVTAVAESLGLDNVTAVHGRVEDTDGEHDYIVSRAVTELKNFMPWIKGRYRKSVLYLKGGDLDREIAEAVRICRLDGKCISTKHISEWFKEEFFAEKMIVKIEKR